MIMISAEVQNKKVIVDGVEVPEVIIMGNGGDSVGVLYIDEERSVYIPKTSPDLEQTLTVVSNALKTIASGILPENAGGAITSGSFSADITNYANQIDQIKGALK